MIQASRSNPTMPERVSATKHINTVTYRCRERLLRPSGFPLAGGNRYKFWRASADGIRSPSCTTPSQRCLAPVFARCPPRQRIAQHSRHKRAATLSQQLMNCCHPSSPPSAQRLDVKLRAAGGRPTSSGAPLAAHPIMPVQVARRRANSRRGSRLGRRESEGGPSISTASWAAAT